MPSYERVAAAWRFGRKAVGTNFSTDGRNLYSWGHKVGWTLPTGRKYAIHCHYSQSTAFHSGLAVDEADEKTECENHGRPDLHKGGDPVEVWPQKDYGPLSLCDDGYKTANVAWREQPEAFCVFRCLRCNKWHAVREEITAFPGKDRRHGGGYSHLDSFDHQIRYECAACRKRVSLKHIRSVHDSIGNLFKTQQDIDIYIQILKPWTPPALTDNDIRGESEYPWQRRRLHGYGSNIVICPECHSLGEAAVNEWKAA